MEPYTLAPHQRALTPVIELQAVLNEHGKLYATMTDYLRSWIIEIRDCDLTSFAIFQAAILRRLGLWIDHRSQRHAEPNQRRVAWQQSVAKAFERGATP